MTHSTPRVGRRCAVIGKERPLIAGGIEREAHDAVLENPDRAVGVNLGHGTLEIQTLAAGPDVELPEARRIILGAVAIHRRHALVLVLMPVHDDVDTRLGEYVEHARRTGALRVAGDWRREERRLME